MITRRMTYWITFAVLTISEEVTDLLLSFWFPLYYEAKAVLLFWLLSPVTRGSSLLYRQVIHPALLTREPHIDALVADWKQQASERWPAATLTACSAELQRGDPLHPGGGRAAHQDRGGNRHRRGRRAGGDLAPLVQPD